MIKFVQDLVDLVSYVIRLFPNWVQSMVGSLFLALLQAYTQNQISWGTLVTFILSYCAIWITSHSAEVFENPAKAPTPAPEPLDPKPAEGEISQPPAPFNTTSGPFQ